MKPAQKPTSVGNFLKNVAMKDGDVSTRLMALSLGDEESKIQLLIDDKIPCDPDLAKELAVETDTSESFWLDMQSKLDEWKAGNPEKELEISDDLVSAVRWFLEKWSLCEKVNAEYDKIWLSALSDGYYSNSKGNRVIMAYVSARISDKLDRKRDAAQRCVEVAGIEVLKLSRNIHGEDSSIHISDVSLAAKLVREMVELVTKTHPFLLEDINK